MNRYQEMGLNEPNMMALDLVDLFTEVSQDPPEVDISPLLSQFADLVGENADKPVREFMPLITNAVKQSLQFHRDPMHDVAYRLEVHRFLSKINAIALRYYVLL